MQSNHRNWRRLVAAPLTALLAAGMLAACSSSDTPDPDGENGQTGGVEGSAITIGTFSPLAPQYELWAEAYMDEFPERSVEILPVSEDFVQYQQTLATQRISGTMPDLIFNVDFLANTFAQDELVMDIAPFLEEGKDGLSLDNFVPQFVDQYRPLGSEEQVMGLPVSADSTALLWNKTLFDEVGVTEYPTEDWTWEDFIRVPPRSRRPVAATSTGPRRQQPTAVRSPAGGRSCWPRVSRSTIRRPTPLTSTPPRPSRSGRST